MMIYIAKELVTNKYFSGYPGKMFAIYSLKCLPQFKCFRNLPMRVSWEIPSRFVLGIATGFFKKILWEFIQDFLLQLLQKLLQTFSNNFSIISCTSCPDTPYRVFSKKEFFFSIFSNSELTVDILSVINAWISPIVSVSVDMLPRVYSKVASAIAAGIRNSTNNYFRSYCTNCVNFCYRDRSKSFFFLKIIPARSLTIPLEIHLEINGLMFTGIPVDFPSETAAKLPSVKSSS